LEARRDIKGLTKNGQHSVVETERAALQRYLLLLAEDQDTIAEHAQTTPPELIAAELQKTAASLRRKALALSLPDPALSSPSS
jgi:hypothetical protein